MSLLRSIPVATVAGLVLLSATSAVCYADSANQRNRWQLEVGPSLWLNTKVSYGTVPSADPAAGAKQNRTYDDGFNRVDASNNLGDANNSPLASRTGFFGYNSATQVDLAGGTLAMNQLQAAGTYLPKTRASNRLSLDLALRRSFAKETSTRDWGLEVGFNSARHSHSSSGSTPAQLRLLTDRYALGGVVPQPAPYAGRLNPSPGDQRIGDLPSRTISTVNGTVTGSRSLSAKTTLVRFGPWMEILPERLSAATSERDRWSLQARGGLAFLSTKLNFSMVEELSAPGLSGRPRTSVQGSSSMDEVRWFAGARAQRVLSKGWRGLAWADYLGGRKFTVAASNRSATWDARRSVLVGLALQYRFR